MTEKLSSTPDDLPGMLAVAKGVAEQRWPHTMDAKVWAEEFAKMYPMIWREGGAVTDVTDVMIGWFANAIMAGYDTAMAKTTQSETASSQWIACTARMPPDETPVLVLRNGEIRMGELRWEHPGYEDTYKAFRYWDDPTNDGQGWEHFEITHWTPLPEKPLGSTER